MEQVTTKIKSKINTCRKMSRVWERLDNEFGRPDKVGARCIQGLVDLSINARNKEQGFILLYDKFMEVRHNLIEVE